MRPRLWICLLLALSGAAWAQDSAQQPPSSSPPPEKQSPAAASDQNSSSVPDPAPNDDPAKKPHAPNLAPPRSDRVQVGDLGSDLGQSSSKDSQIDLSPPADDAQTHPQSSTVVAEAEAGISPGGVSEFHTWDPHKAAKSMEVGDFYFKRKNYRAAEERYREALHYKNNDALATIRLAVCLEKLGVFDDARVEYEAYLKLLPHGPEAEQAQKAIDRLKASATGPGKP